MLVSLWLINTHKSFKMAAEYEYYKSSEIKCVQKLEVSATTECRIFCCMAGNISHQGVNTTRLHCQITYNSIRYRAI